MSVFFAEMKTVEMDTDNRECFPVVPPIVIGYLDFYSMAWIRTETEGDIFDAQTLFAFSQNIQIIMFAMPFWR